MDTDSFIIQVDCKKPNCEFADYFNLSNLGKNYQCEPEVEIPSAACFTKPVLMDKSLADMSSAF